MGDRYTKIVLTVIAAALAILALENALPRAVAQSSCGAAGQPCLVQVVQNGPLWVTTDFAVTPVTDDSPFFFQLTRWSRLKLSSLASFTGRNMLEPVALPAAQIVLVVAPSVPGQYCCRTRRIREGQSVASLNCHRY